MNQLMEMNINPGAILRRIRKNLLLLLLTAIMAAALSYAVVDVWIPRTYSITVDVSITANRSNKRNLTSRKISDAVTRYVNLINSDVMKKELADYLEREEIPGEIEADDIYGTNIITVVCTSNRPEDALRIAEGFRHLYAKINSQSLIVKLLGTDSVDNLKATGLNSWLISTAVFVLVFLIGILLVMILSIFDRRVLDSRQAEKRLNTNILGVIPHEKKKTNMTIVNLLCTADYIESIRKTTESLQKVMESKKLKTITITSVSENEGKTTFAANMALALEEKGYSVALIDADLRRSAVSKVLEVPVKTSLSRYLKENIPMKDLVYYEKRLGLFLCLNHGSCSDADELLDSQKFQHLLEVLQQTMDYIIIDTSPAGVSRDAEVIMTENMGMVIVARTETADILMINEVANRLNDNYSAVLGCVINDEFRKKTGWNQHDFHHGNPYGNLQNMNR